MPVRILIILLLPWLAGPGFAQDSSGETAKVKEQELAEVRERISALKQSMDDAAEERDRVTAELQELDIAIAERRTRLREIEREHKYAADKKARLDAELAEALRNRQLCFAHAVYLEAILFALLDPTATLKQLEADGNRAGRLALLDEMNTMPFGAVWEALCAREETPTDGAWQETCAAYEQDVLSSRG